MKLVAVSDVFMHPEYYTEAVKNFPEFELTKVIHFGEDDRSIMREISYKIERGGSEAVERKSERMDAAYSPRIPRGGAFGHRRANRKFGKIYDEPRKRACCEKTCNLSPSGV